MKRIEHNLKFGDVIFAPVNGDDTKTATVTKTWYHESDRHGNGWSRCSKCLGCVEGYVNYRYCPHCGEKLGK